MEITPNDAIALKKQMIALIITTTKPTEITKTNKPMAQQKADPKLIDSMALRYRHDFGFLDEPQKEVIRTKMKQLWEEVVGLGFYKPNKPMAQQTAVDWLVNKFQKFLSYYEGNHKAEPYTIEELSNDFEQAKQMEVYQHGLFLHWFIKHYSTATIDGMFGFVNAMGKEVTVKEIVDQYYNETYGNNQNK